jgi:hypothetical protein
MAKKRNASAADDLIKSLLDDVNGDDSLPKDKLFLTSEEAKATNSIQFPVGLDPKKKDFDPRKSRAEAEDPGATHASDNDETGAKISDTKTMPLKSPHHSDYDSKISAEPAVSVVAPPSGATKPALKKVVAPTPIRKDSTVSTVSHLDASLVQAENLRIAQQRILQLEEEVDRYRNENEEIASAAEIVSHRADELQSRVQQLERNREEMRENANAEIMIVKGQLQFKDSELNKALQKMTSAKSACVSESLRTVWSCCGPKRPR